MTKYLDVLLARYSMYRVTAMALFGLFLVALVAGASGSVAYSPLAMTVTWLAFGPTGFAANTLFGWLFGRKIHVASSFITGLILFFIFTPTTELSTLVVYALIALIAAASKYALAYKSRHIFNPAAIAAFIIGLSGMAYASWWVATPVLAPATLLFGALVLYKTRQLTLGLVFIIIAATAVVANLMYQGDGLTEALGLLPSWPFLFLGAFMLTEPLTLPPKRWQRLVEAAVVALILAVPMHIGGFSTSPAFALVVGNVLAFALYPRAGITLKFVKRLQLTPTSYEFVFEPNSKHRFEAGQYIELMLPHAKEDSRGTRRPFSITSAPGDHELKICVKFYKPSSTFKHQLLDLKKGTIVHATSINGDFTLPKNQNEKLLCIAGGIGITPFISQLRSLINIKQSRDIVLVYAVSHPSELAYVNILEQSGIKVILCSTVLPNLPNEQWQHIVAAAVTKQVLESTVPDIANRSVYISGAPAMVQSTKRAAKSLGARNVATDYFTGY